MQDRMAIGTTPLCAVVAGIALVWSKTRDFSMLLTVYKSRGYRLVDSQ
jgi:hypothetical protein